MTSLDYSAYASKVLAGIYQDTDYERLLESLRQVDPHFLDISPEKFGMEFLAVRLALACHAWSKMCQEADLIETGIENAFMKTVMQSFQSPKFLEIAKAYSEYLHSPQANSRPVLSITANWMKRLGLAGTMEKDEKPVLTPGFQALMEISEAFKNQCENDFFEFSHSKPE